MATGTNDRTATTRPDRLQRNSQKIALVALGYRDNAPEMASPAPRPYPEDHPVELDIELRERVLDVMWFKIQKTISSGAPAKRRSASTADLQLAGGIRADAVLNAALDGVLRKDPAELVGTWEAYATGVAHNKAVQAVRDNVKGRTRAGKEIDLGSTHREDAKGRTLGDNVVDPLADPEREAIELAQERIVQRLAHQLLSARDRDIFFRRHYLWQPLKAIADRHDLTEPGARHVYVQCAKKVLAAARQDPEFQRLSDPDRGGSG